MMTEPLDTFFNVAEFGDAATYNGSVATVVILDKDLTLEQGHLHEVIKTMRVKMADVGTPKRGDTFVVGATTYTVDATIEHDGSVATVAVRG
jgi:hypothetical protein